MGTTLSPASDGASSLCYSCGNDSSNHSSHNSKTDSTRSTHCKDGNHHCGSSNTGSRSQWSNEGRCISNIYLLVPVSNLSLVSIFICSKWRKASTRYKTGVFLIGVRAWKKLKNYTRELYDWQRYGWWGTHCLHTTLYGQSYIVFFFF